jgi:hypothetical protein
MNANISKQKYTSRFGDGPERSADTDAEGTEHLGAYGLLRGSRDRSEMLELRKKTGNIRAISYAWLEKVDFDPSTGLTLYAGQEKIRIKGRNLDAIASHHISLLGGVLRKRVPWISESNQSALLQADKDAVVVESIDW